MVSLWILQKALERRKTIIHWIFPHVILLIFQAIQFTVTLYFQIVWRPYTYIWFLVWGSLSPIVENLSLVRWDHYVVQPATYVPKFIWTGSPQKLTSLTHPHAILRHPGVIPRLFFILQNITCEIFWRVLATTRFWALCTVYCLRAVTL